jgi:hypothetical protein
MEIVSGNIIHQTLYDSITLLFQSSLLLVFGVHSKSFRKIQCQWTYNVLVDQTVLMMRILQTQT